MIGRKLLCMDMESEVWAERLSLKLSGQPRWNVLSGLEDVALGVERKYHFCEESKGAI